MVSTFVMLSSEIAKPLSSTVKRLNAETKKICMRSHRRRLFTHEPLGYRADVHCQTMESCVPNPKNGPDFFFCPPSFPRAFSHTEIMHQIVFIVNANFLFSPAPAEPKLRVS